MNPPNTQLDFAITPQPDDITCGASCLHAVYRYHGDELAVEDVIRDVPQLEGGGTLSVFLGLHALRRGYEAAIYTNDLQMFDPSWFGPDAPPLGDRLRAQTAVKTDPKLRVATEAYIELLELGGRVFMEDINSALIGRFLRRGAPIVTALSSTWLYRCRRERPADGEPDDVAGEPAGHFVVVCGLDLRSRRVQIADPYLHHPYPASHLYEVPMHRLIGAILLGIVTFDAKLLIVTPRES